MYSYLIRHNIAFLTLLLLRIGTSVLIYLPLTTKVLLEIITSHEGCQYKLIQPIVYTAIFLFPFRQPTLLVMLEVLKSYWWEVWDLGYNPQTTQISVICEWNKWLLFGSKIRFFEKNVAGKQELLHLNLNW